MRIDWRSLQHRIPSRAQIAAGVYYDVVWVSDFNGQDLCGTTTFDPKVITVKLGMSPKLTVETYLHEVCHAFSEEFDIKLTEAQILKMEKAMPYILKDDNLFKPKRKSS